MALELNKLTSSVDALGANAAKRLADLNERFLPAAEEMLKMIRADDDDLQKKIKAARKHRWAGAIPTDEPVDAVFATPPHPTRANIIAADGSQIYPDRHGIALYFLINIGSIVFRHGLDEAPGTSSTPQVFYEDDEMYYAEESSPINGEMVNAMRDVRELGELARLAETEAQTAPTVTLLDNGLLMFISLREQNRKFSEEITKTYLSHLDTLRASGAAPAGVVDRPRAANVVRLLNLAKMELKEIGPDTLRGVGPFRGVTDAMVFGFLRPGERSAVFVNASPDNDLYYVPGGHTIYFFYLNAGRPGKDALLRIEIPQWIATDKTKLDLVHAAIVEQCRVSDGFPYVLMRAHELAVVTVNERREFEQMVIGSLIRRGLTPGISQKAQGKQWTGSGKKKYPR
ncbi:MAG: DNA double-strand break repair nuclease NurA, partial [Chloroflexota bacterium]